MEIKCTKCRYKFDVTPNEGQMEMTVVCPRCGATQTLMVPPDIPVEKEIPAAPIADVEPVVAVVPPVMPSGSIPEEHMKYVPRADEAPVVDDNTQTAPEQETKPVAEEIPQQEKRRSKAAPVPPAKKNSSCGKMFALGCLIVAVLAILTIAILAFAGKSFFNSISSGDDDEQEQVDRTDRNITIQPENSNEAGTTTTDNQQPAPDTQQPATTTQPAPVTDTGGEGNDNTSVAEPPKPTDEQKEKANSDVATAGGSYNCRGTMAGNNIDMKINSWMKAFANVDININNAYAGRGDFWGAAANLRPNWYNPLIPISSLDMDNQTIRNMVETTNNIIDGNYLLGGSSVDTSTL